MGLDAVLKPAVEAPGINLARLLTRAATMPPQPVLLDFMQGCRRCSSCWSLLAMSIPAFCEKGTHHQF